MKIITSKNIDCNYKNSCCRKNAQGAVFQSGLSLFQKKLKNFKFSVDTIFAKLYSILTLNKRAGY